MGITLNQIQNDTASIEIKNASGDALLIDGSGFLTMNMAAGQSIAVTATDLDIRNLLFATDKVDVSGSSITVSATDLDIRDLAFASDSVTAHQGGSWAVTIDNISSWKNTAETATTTASEIVATPFASRSSMIIQNLGNQDVYLGPDNSVTTSNGLLLPKGSSLDIGMDGGADVWVVTSSGTADLRVSEYAA